MSREAKINTLEKELKKLYETYISSVEMIAAEARRELLVPYLRPRGWEFVTGNGTWLVYDDSKTRYLPDGSRAWNDYSSHMNDNLPDWLDRLMKLEVEGSWGNSELALWMLDYTTKKTKNGGGQK